MFKCCNRCRKIKPLDQFRETNRLGQNKVEDLSPADRRQKLCIPCNERIYDNIKRNRCPHYLVKRQCHLCNREYCSHGRRRSRCRFCRQSRRPTKPVTKVKAPVIEVKDPVAEIPVAKRCRHDTLTGLCVQCLSGSKIQKPSLED